MQTNLNGQKAQQWLPGMESRWGGSGGRLSLGSKDTSERVASVLYLDWEDRSIDVYCPRETKPDTS